MHETVKYINHLGETIEFGRGDYFINYNDLRDYTWDYDTDNNIISNFSRGHKSKSIPIIICGKNGAALKNRLFEVFEKDVLTSQKGAFWIGEYYYRCYVVQSKKSNYLNSINSVTVSVSTITDEPYWCKEIKYTFLPIVNHTVDGGKYPMKYPYRYTGDIRQFVTNDTLSSATFKLLISGPCNNPEIFIGDQRYKINVELAAGQNLKLTALDDDKTISLINVNGSTENVFHKRDKTTDVFAPIPSGSFNVTWDNSFSFELTVYDRRSEPLWI